MQKQAKGRLDGRGTIGSLSGTNPREVQGSQNATDPLNSGQAQIPPELLDAQRRFREK